MAEKLEEEPATLVPPAAHHGLPINSESAIVASWSSLVDL